MVGCCFNPSHLPPERTLPLPCTSYATRCARALERAGRVALLLPLPLLLAAAGCRDAFAGFGAGPRARSDADQLFGALAGRYDDVARNPKYEHARRAIMKGALTPTRPFEDSAAWTGSSGNVRLLETFGSYADGKYLLASRPGVPSPRAPADGRHVTTLSRLSDGEFRWDTTVDFALGQVRPADIAAVISALIASAEGKTEREARADLLAAAPRTAAALGTAFSLDSLRPTLLPDGTTAVTLAIRMRSDLLRRRYPAFGAYFQKYVDPTRYRFVLADRAGVAFAEASARERLLTVRLRLLNGEMIPLAGAPRAMPDTLTLLADFRMKVRIFTVGFHGLSMDFVNGGRGDVERFWTFTARREPRWDLPLATARLIRAPLRRPFAGEGAMFRIGVRADPNAPTVLVRHSRLAVQESAILRFLNSLGSTAMGDFLDQVEREENAWLRELFVAMRDDARAALAP